MCPYTVSTEWARFIGSAIACLCTRIIEEVLCRNRMKYRCALSMSKAAALGRGSRQERIERITPGNPGIRGNHPFPGDCMAADDLSLVRFCVGWRLTQHGIIKEIDRDISGTSSVRSLKDCKTENISLISWAVSEQATMMTLCVHAADGQNEPCSMWAAEDTSLL